LLARSTRTISIFSVFFLAAASCQSDDAAVTANSIFPLCSQHTSETVLTSFYSPEDFTSLCHQYHLRTKCIRQPDLIVIVYHDVLAPNHRWRGFVTPAKRGKGAKRIANTDVRSPAERHVAMSWAQRLKRVFNIDVEVSVLALDR
jgi:hypothetical protein